jgi:DNA repair protein RecO (recombination protein O)
MAAEKTTAIVLRVVEFSETSAVVTLFTRDFGKITALAKGARRKNSPFEAALDVLAICRIVFLHKSSGAMDLLTEAKLERRFRSAATSLDHLYAGYYVVELLRCLTDEHDPHPRAYDLAEATICGLDSQDSVGQSLLEFELGLLTQLGHQPILTRCSCCGREKREASRVSFGLNEGGVLCQKCRSGKQNIVSLSHEAWSYMNSLTAAIAALSKQDDGQVRIDRSRITEPTGEVRKLMNQYMTHLLGFRPRLQQYIGSFI